MARFAANWQVAGFALVATFVAGAQASPSPAPMSQKMPATSMPVSAQAPLTEAQKARFVLDRLGFGARPGEVEKVEAMGAMAWIDRQLLLDQHLLDRPAVDLDCH